MIMLRLDRYAVILLAILAATCNGCGYVSSGEWTDDRGNWTRAFGGTTPQGVTVLNSWYMRTPHFTAEYAWYFKLKLDSESRKRVETDLEFAKLDIADAIRVVQQTYNDRPAWFPVENLERFDAFRSKSQPNFVILLERDGELSYWTSHQL